jgi:hypothetical protein
VRAALLPEDVAEFDAEFQAAMAEAARTFDLAVVTACVERWWRVAWSSADPVGHRRMDERAGRLLAGREVPTVRWEQLKTKLGL